MTNGTPPISKIPKWETLVMIGSFALVWAYFLVFQSAKRANEAPHLAWNVALLVAAGILVGVFVRRLKRILAALNGQDKRQ